MCKRYLGKGLTLLIMVIMLSGCGITSKGNKVTETSSPEISSEASPVASEGYSSKDVWWGDKEYYGAWKVKERIKTSSIYGLPEEEIEKLLGTDIYIMESYYDSTSLNGRISDPVYNEMIMETEDIVKGFKMNEADKESLFPGGIKEVLFVDIKFPEGENSFGSKIFLVNRDTLLVMENGAFFKAERFTPADGELPEEEVTTP